MPLHQQLVAIVLHVFAAYGLANAPHAREVAEADATAIEAQKAPASRESVAVDAGDLAVYEALEGQLDPDVVAYDPLAEGEKSCGILQERCPFVWSHTLVEQVAWWLWAERHSSLAGVDSSPTRARKRHARARELVAEAVAGMTADADAAWVAQTAF